MEPGEASPAESERIEVAIAVQEDATVRAEADQSAAMPLPAPRSATKAAKPALGGMQKFLLYFVLPSVAGLVMVVVVFRAISTFAKPNLGGSPTADSTPEPSEPISGAVSESELGVAVYPGATPTSDGDRRTVMDNAIVSQSFVSDAPVDQVINFYKSKMVGYASIYASGSGVAISMRPNARESIEVSIGPATRGGKTSFTISHSKKSSG